MPLRPLVLAPALAVALLVGGCAGPADGPGSAGGPTGAAPDAPGAIAAPGEVRGQGTVIQVGDAAPQLCLGPILEIYPPQCSGPEISGWDWDAVDGDETSGDTTWGAYAVTGTWDGAVFGVTSAIMLALYDPMPVEDPLLDPDNAGDTDPAELERIQTELQEAAPFPIMGSGIVNGYLFVDVLYDDGSLQAYVDATYLPDAVAVRGALTDLPG